MFLTRTIQYKALLLLTVFSANFFVVCHCAARARASGHHSCCAKKEQKPPCKEGNECGGMHAVKFHLAEKQVAKQVSPEPMQAVAIGHMPEPHLTITYNNGSFPEPLTFRHPPPDYQSLYQCFLI